MDKDLHKICNQHVIQSECEHYQDAMKRIDYDYKEIQPVFRRWHRLLRIQGGYG